MIKKPACEFFDTWFFPVYADAVASGSAGMTIKLLGSLYSYWLETEFMIMSAVGVGRWNRKDHETLRGTLSWRGN